jgi:hypothetical protein
MAKIPVGAAIAHAYRFAFGNFLTVLRAMALPLVLQLALSIVMINRVVPALKAMQANDPSAFSQLGPVLLLYPIALVLFFVQFTSFTEAALGQPAKSWLHFPIGKNMWRLLGGFVLAALAIIGVAAAFAIAGYLLLLLLGAILKVSAPVAAKAVIGLAAAVMILAVYGGLIFLVVRFFFLLAPVNIAEQRLGVGRAWLLSRGNFWRAFLIVLAILIPVIVVEYAAMFAVAGWPPLPRGGGHQAIQAARLAWQITALTAASRYWYIAIPLFAVMMVLYLGAGCAAQAFAYRKLTEDEVSAPVAAD